MQKYGDQVLREYGDQKEAVTLERAGWGPMKRLHERAALSHDKSGQRRLKGLSTVPSPPTRATCSD